MADQTLGAPALPTPSQATQAQSPMEGAHIQTHEFDPGGIQHAISVHIVTGHLKPHNTDPVGGITSGIAQAQVVFTPSLPTGNHSQVIQPSLIAPLAISPHTNPSATGPYQPFASTPGSPPPTPPAHPQNAAPSGFFNPASSPALTANNTTASTTIAPTAPSSNPSQSQPPTPPSQPPPQVTPPTHNAAPSITVNTTQPAPQTLPQHGSTSTGATQAIPHAAPPLTTTQSPTSPTLPSQETPITNALTPPSHSKHGFHSESLASHIQNVLATVLSSGSKPYATELLNQNPQSVSPPLPSGQPSVATSVQPSPSLQSSTTPNTSSSVQTQPTASPSLNQPQLIQPTEVVSPLPASLREGQRDTPPLRDTSLSPEKPPHTPSAPREESTLAPLGGARPLIELNVQPPAQPLDQHTITIPEQRQQQRLEQVRDIQQITAVERELLRPTNEPLSRDISSAPTDSREQTSQALERVRESLLDKLTGLQSRIETAATERQRIDDLRSPIDTRIQGRDILTRPDPIHHDTKPSLVARLADRLHERSPLPTGVREPLIGLTSTALTERARIRHTDSTSPLLSASASPAAQSLERPRHSPERLSHLIELLKRFSERSVNFRLLSKMDTSLEKACLTVVTGAALGVVGLELLYRAATLVVVQTLGFLRDEQPAEDSPEAAPEQSALERGLEGDLNECVTVELSTVGEQGFVVDLAGIVVSAATGEPISTIEVSCAEFGSCTTGPTGHFIFENIPLGTPYTITASSPTKRLAPLVVTGICGELEFLRIRVEEIS